MLKKLFQAAVQNIVDPDRDQRRAELRSAVDQGLRALREKFQLSRDLSLSKYPQADVEAVQRDVIQSILVRAKTPGLLTEGERATLEWILRSLEASRDVRSECLIEFVSGPFEARLRQMLSRDRLDPSDLVALDDLAATVGTDARTLIAARHRQQAFDWTVARVRREMLGLAPNFGRIHAVRSDAYRLGVDWNATLAAVRPDALAITERTLADAKCDGVITLEEEQALERLLDEFHLPDTARQYVRRTVHHVRYHHDLRSGKLPSLYAPAGIALRAGEIVHYVGRATLRTTKQRASGPETRDRFGTLVLTDNRVLFSGDEGAKVFVLRQIVECRTHNGWIQLLLSQQAPYVLIAHDDPYECGLILESALRMANQTLVREATADDRRHIPRDVRQRVFQRYGGRCADCGATEYLEFDHIIPVAKGGGNSDQNVQLLCRNCNLRKSAHI